MVPSCEKAHHDWNQHRQQLKSHLRIHASTFRNRVYEAVESVLTKKILDFRNANILALSKIVHGLLRSCLAASLLMFVEGILDMLSDRPKNGLKILSCARNELGQVCEPSEICICTGVLGVRDRIKNRLKEAHR